MATGEHWGYQRCGRYAYQRVLIHTTNPDHQGQYAVADGHPAPSVYCREWNHPALG